MTSTTVELTVFVASPSDCDGERRRLREVADNLTQAMASYSPVRIRVVGSEHMSPDLGRPQDRINTQLLDDCDLFVGFLRYRLGTPTGGHDSGFVEEFERVRRRRGAADRPRIALYFHELDDDRVSDAGPQLEGVLEFRERIQGGQLAQYATYSSFDDLGQRLWMLLSEEVQRVLAAAMRPNDEARSGTSTRSSERSTGLDAELDEARQQIAEVTQGIADVARGGDASLDSDRLLLVALALNRDGGTIPTHVVNRLYRRREDLALSVGEHDLWVRTLLSDLGTATRVSRTVPGWAVLGRMEDYALTLLELDDEPAIVAGLLRVWSRCRERPRALWDGAEGIERVASLLDRPGVRNDVVACLAATASPDDLSFLDAVLEVEDDEVLRGLRALLGGDAGPVAHAVATRYSPSDWQVEAVRSRVADLDDEALAALVMSSRVPIEIRRDAFYALEPRGGISVEVIRGTITRPELADLIFDAAADSESSVGIEEVAEAVEKVERPWAGDAPDRVRALQATKASLEEQLEGTFAYDAWATLSWTDELESQVSRAREVFDTDADEFIARLPDEESWRRLHKFIRARSRLSALRILLAHDPVAPEDRARVRAEAARSSDYTSPEASLLLASVASDAEDLAVLENCLSKSLGDARRAIVLSILTRGGAASARGMVRSDVSHDAGLAALALTSDEAVGIDELRELLYSPHEEVRMIALDALIKKSSRHDLETLLSSYSAASGIYYYNVIVELDWLLHGEHESSSS